MGGSRTCSRLVRTTAALLWLLPDNVSAAWAVWQPLLLSCTNRNHPYESVFNNKKSSRPFRMIRSGFQTIQQQQQQPQQHSWSCSNRRRHQSKQRTGASGGDDVWWLNSSRSHPDPDNSHENNNNNPPPPPRPVRRRRQQQQQRARLAGVSVSNTGFWVVLQMPMPSSNNNNNNNNNKGCYCYHYCAIRVTDQPQGDCDGVATSPQALTLLQLAVGVDMAGMVLPPDLLARLTVLYGEELQQPDETNARREDDTDTATRTDNALARAAILQAVQCQLPQPNNNEEEEDGPVLFSEQPAWVQARVSLPVCTMDHLYIYHSKPNQRNTTMTSETSATTAMPDTSLQWQFRCQVSCRVLPRKDETTTTPAAAIYSLTVVPSDHLSQQVCYEYRPDGVSTAFLSMALALRYKAPITLVVVEEDDDEDDMATATNDNKEEDEDEAGTTSTTDHQDEHAPDETDHDITRSFQTPQSSSSSSSSLLFLTHDQLLDHFPLYQTIAEISNMSRRAVQAVTTGFEIHQLQAALDMARQKGDWVAAAKIRKVLDEKDSLQQWPVQPESDTSRME